MCDECSFASLLSHYGDYVAAGVCEVDTWQLFYANAELRKIFNLSSGSLNPSALSKWLEQGAIQDMPQAADDKGRLLFQDANGSYYIIQWWLPNHQTEKARCFIIQDIPLNELNPGIFQNQKEIDSILDFIHDGIWIIDGQGITRRINRAMERIAGIRAEEVVGRHVSEPLREGRFKTCVTLRALKVRHTVTLFDDYSNGKRCLNTSTPIFDSLGNVWRVIAAIRDITELETLQNRLSHLEVEAMAYRLRVQGLENETNNILLGQSPILQRILQDITKAAQTDAITLILGETGTGKTMAAKAIHEISNRARKPFVTVNCGAIPASLMESELFGYAKGAFTGASRNGKPGMIELAAGGTLLLDEIGELSLPMQAKLLHLLDGEPVYRVGGTHPFAMEARIIAATNRSLEDMVQKGLFRQDLFYRLRVLCIEMPPLRERREDILLLAWHFLQKAYGNIKAKQLDPRVEQLFLAYEWPGNVRELQSVIQSLATLCEHDKIIPADLPSYMREKTHPGSQAKFRNLNEAISRLEKEMLTEALAESGSSYKAARQLGISQSSVVRKAKKYGISLSEHMDDRFETHPESGAQE